MGLINSISTVPMTLMKFTSSIFSSVPNFLAAKVGFEGAVSSLFNGISKVMYFVAKWMLYVLDILFSFIRQLSGLEMKYDSLESMVSKESDFVFNMLFTATDLINPIIRNLIGLSIALIIFFAILAVVKTQFNSLKSKTPADIKGVLKDTGRAFVLLIVTPMIAIMGIVGSNLLLQSLYRATNTTNSNSISSSLFSVSATSASAYRIYAQEDMRIPITFDFTEHAEILEYYKKHAITKEFREYVNSNKNLIYYLGYKPFTEGNFSAFSTMNDTRVIDPNSTQAVNAKNYYQVYDRTQEAYEALNSTTVNSYKKISAYRPEYFVMADVIDFGIETSTVMYFKTIQEVLESISQTGDDYLFNSTVALYKIQFLDSDLKVIKRQFESVDTATETASSYATYKEIYKGSWSVIRFTSTYYDVNAESEPTKKMQIQYNHVRDAVDEIQGAKFIMTVQENLKRTETRQEYVEGALTTITEDVVHTYYYPLTIGLSQGNEFVFDSEYIQTGQLIAAKGVFSQERYGYPVPTAIRISEDGSEVQFYRHDIESVTVGDSDQAGTGTMKAEEDKGGFLSWIKKLFAFLNPNFDVKIDQDALVTAYQYSETVVNVLPSGKLNVSYMFEDGFSNNLLNFATGVVNVVNASKGEESVEQMGIHGLLLENVFIPNKINMIILICGSLMLVKIVFTAIFQLINRGYELFLTIIVYPTACATIPIMDKDDGYKTWMTTFVSRLFSTYGLVLGLNFVLMLFPVIAELEVFTAGEIALSKPIMRFRNLFSTIRTVATIGIVQAPISFEFLAGFLNMVVVIIFQLVAFTLLETIPETINRITKSAPLRGVNPIESAKKVLKVVAAIVKTISSVVGGIKDFIMIAGDIGGKREEFIRNAKMKVKGFLPGSEIVESAKDFGNMQKKKHEQKEAMNELKDAMNTAKVSGKDEKDKTPEEKEQDKKSAKEIQEKFNKVLEAQDNYQKSIADPRGNRLAEDDKRRANERKGLDENGRVSSRDEGDDETGLSHRTKRQLRKEKKRASKIVKRLKKEQKLANKGKRGELTEAEQASLNKYTKILENVNSAQQEQKKNGKEISQAKKTIKKLTKKRGETSLNAEEEAQLKAAEATVEEGEQRKVDNKKARTDEKVERKERARIRKKDAKDEEKKKKISRAFKRTGLGAKIAQKRYMKDVNKQSNKIQEALNATGYMGKRLEDMTAEERKQTMESGTLTESQVGMFKAYEALQAQKSENLGYADAVNASKAAQGANGLRMKNRFKAGRRSGNKIQKKLMQTEERDAQELEKIEAELESLGATGDNSGVTAANLGRVRKLKQRRQELLSREQFRDYWSGKKGADGTRTGGRNTKTKKEVKKEKKGLQKRGRIQRDLVEQYGTDISEEELSTRTNQKLEKKKKKKKKDTSDY